MGKKYKHVIWSNEDLDIKDYKDYFEEEYKGVVLSDDEKYEIIQMLNNNYFEDEMFNLNKKLKGRVIVIADIGRWNGRVTGYKIGGNNLNDIFRLIGQDDYITWYSDGRNIKGVGYHHDGKNFYEFREIREDRTIDNLTSKLYNQEEVSRQQINYYTKSLHKYVADIYGW